MCVGPNAKQSLKRVFAVTRVKHDIPVEQQRVVGERCAALGGDVPRWCLPRRACRRGQPSQCMACATWTSLGGSRACATWTSLGGSRACATWTSLGGSRACATWTSLGGSRACATWSRFGERYAPKGTPPSAQSKRLGIFLVKRERLIPYHTSWMAQTTARLL